MPHASVASPKPRQFAIAWALESSYLIFKYRHFRNAGLSFRSSLLTKYHIGS